MLVLNEKLQRELSELTKNKKSSDLRLKMGWLPDLPDFRDYTIENNEALEMVSKLGLNQNFSNLPNYIDLRKDCSPIEDQGNLGSCTAQAGVGMIEYYEKRAFNRHIDASKLFLYKVTRNLIHTTGDTGAYLRSTMAAMKLFGAPPESYYPYNIADFDIEPPAFCYSFAQNYQSINYLRLDPIGTDRNKIFNDIKNSINAKLPSMFGFTVYDSITQANSNGQIPFPTQKDRIVGGHAIMAVGYDDNMIIRNTNEYNDNQNVETQGAFIIRNSWGTSWGENGYGYLPYQYVLSGLARDWWILLNQEWVDTNNFGI